MGDKKDSAISRREFAKRAAMVSAAASFVPANLLNAGLPASLPQPQQPATATKLSPEGQAEVDSRIQAILSQYGSRLSETQKADLRRLATEAQAPLDRLRSYATENGDGPALYLKPLLEREKKATPAAAAPKPAAPPKSS